MRAVLFPESTAGTAENDHLLGVVVQVASAPPLGGAAAEVPAIPSVEAQPYIPPPAVPVRSGSIASKPGWKQILPGELDRVARGVAIRQVASKASPRSWLENASGRRTA